MEEHQGHPEQEGLQAAGGIFTWDRPSAESAVLYPLWLAKTAYPEYFKDVGMVREVKGFHREIISFKLILSHPQKHLNN